MTLQPPLVSNGPPLFSNRQHFPKPQIMLRMAFVERGGSLFVLYELLYCSCIVLYCICIWISLCIVWAGRHKKPLSAYIPSIVFTTLPLVVFYILHKKDHICNRPWIWTDFWIQSLSTQFRFPMEWIFEKKYTSEIFCEECGAYTEDGFIHRRWNRRRIRERQIWEKHGWHFFLASFHERLRQVVYFRKFPFLPWCTCVTCCCFCKTLDRLLK